MFPNTQTQFPSSFDEYESILRFQGWAFFDPRLLPEETWSYLDAITPPETSIAEWETVHPEPFDPPYEFLQASNLPPGSLDPIIHEVNQRIFMDLDTMLFGSAHSQIINGAIFGYKTNHFQKNHRDPLDSLLIYPSRDFTGGEICLPDPESFRITPYSLSHKRSILYVMADMQHEVLPVTSGFRSLVSLIVNPGLSDRL